MWKLNTTLLNKHWVHDNIKMEIKYLETNANGKTSYQYCRMQQKQLSRGKCIAINVYIKKSDLKQPNFTSQVTEELIKPKVVKRRK